MHGTGPIFGQFVIIVNSAEMKRKLQYFLCLCFIRAFMLFIFFLHCTFLLDTAIFFLRNLFKVLYQFQYVIVAGITCHFLAQAKFIKRPNSLKSATLTT